MWFRFKIRPVIAIFIIIIMIVPIVPVNIVIAKAQGDTPPLGLMIYKYRRMINLEKEWIKNNSFILFYKDNRKYSFSNLYMKYIFNSTNLTIRMPIYPEGPMNRTFTPIEEGDALYIPPRSVYNRSLKDLPLYCHVLSSVYPHMWKDVIPTEISSDFSKYILWVERANGTGERPAVNFLGLAYYRLYFMDHIPAFIHEGNAYATWCLPFSAIYSSKNYNLLTAQAGSRGTILTRPSLAVDPQGIEWFFVQADILKRTYPNLDLSSITSVLLYNISEWNNLTDEEAARRLLILQLLQTYIPIYNDLSIKENYRDWDEAVTSIPNDDSLIITLFPMSLENADWINEEFPWFQFNRRGLGGYYTKGGMLDASVSSRDLAPLYSLYTGTGVPGEGKYNVTVWVQGPAMLVRARPTTDLASFIPSGVSYRRVSPGIGPAMEKMLWDPGIYWKGQEYRNVAQMLNSVISIPSDFSTILGGPYPFIAPYGPPTTFLTFSVDLSKPWEAMMLSTFMVYFDPYQLRNSPADYAIIHIVIDGQGEEYHRVLIVKATGGIFNYNTVQTGFTTKNTMDYFYNIDYDVGYRGVGRLHGKITVEREMRLEAKANLVGYYYNTKRYIFTHNYTVKDKYIANLYVKEWLYYPNGTLYTQSQYNGYNPSAYTHMYQYILIEKSNLDKLFDPLIFWDNVTLNMSYEALIGGVSPFPNAALPYWMPSSPSPTIPPAYTPKPESILYYTSPVVHEGNKTELLPIVPGPEEALGHISPHLEASYYAYGAVQNTYDLIFGEEGRLLNVKEIPSNITPDMAIEGKPEWLYYFMKNMEPGNSLKGYATFVPTVIRSVTLMADQKISAIPAQMRYGTNHFNKIGLIIYNIELSIWDIYTPEKPETRVLMLAGNVPSILSIIDLEQPINYNNRSMAELFIISQFPTLNMYNLTLPFTGGSILPIQLDATEYGWSDDIGSDIINHSSGLSWYQYNISNWAVGFGLPALLQQRGKNTGFYAYDTWISREIFGTARVVGLEQPLIVGDKLIVREPVFGAQYSNDHWIPLGDGKMFIPVFLQSIHPAPRERYYNYSYIELERHPSRIYSPGEHITLNIKLYSLEYYDHVDIVYEGEGYPIIFNETPTSVPLNTSVYGHYEGSIELNIMNRSKIKELLNNTLNATVPIVRNIIIVKTPDNQSWSATIIQVMVEPGLVINIRETPLKYFIYRGKLVPYKTIDPLILKILAENITIILNNGTEQRIYTYNRTDKEFSEMQFKINDSSLAKGVYNATVRLGMVLPLDYMKARELIIYLGRDTFLSYAMLYARYLRWREESPNSFMKINITLDLGQITYDPEKSISMNITLPFKELVITLSALYSSSHTDVSPLGIMLPTLWYDPAYGVNCSSVDNIIDLAAKLAPIIDQENRSTSTIMKASFHAKAAETNQTSMLDNCFHTYYTLLVVKEAGKLFENITNILINGIKAPREAEIYDDANGSKVLLLTSLVEALYLSIPTQIIAPYSFLAGYGLAGVLMGLSSSYTAQVMWGLGESVDPNPIDLVSGDFSPPVNTIQLLEPRFDLAAANPLLFSIANNSLWEMSDFFNTLNTSLIAVEIIGWSLLTPGPNKDGRDVINTLYTAMPIALSSMVLTAYEQHILRPITKRLVNMTKPGFTVQNAAEIMNDLLEFNVLEIDSVEENLTQYTWLVANYLLVDLVDIASGSLHFRPRFQPNIAFYEKLEKQTIEEPYSSDEHVPSIDKFQCHYYLNNTKIITPNGTIIWPIQIPPTRLGLCTSPLSFVQYTYYDLAPIFVKTAEMQVALILGEALVGIGGIMSAGISAKALGVTDLSLELIKEATRIPQTVLLTDPAILQKYGWRKITPYGVWRASLFESRHIINTIEYRISKADQIAWEALVYNNMLLVVSEEFRTLKKTIFEMIERLRKMDMELPAYEGYPSYMQRMLTMEWEYPEMAAKGYHLVALGYSLFSTSEKLETLIRYAEKLARYADPNNTASNISIFLTWAITYKTVGDSFLIEYEKAVANVMAGAIESPTYVSTMTAVLAIYSYAFSALQLADLLKYLAAASKLDKQQRYELYMQSKIDYLSPATDGPITVYHDYNPIMIGVISGNTTRTLTFSIDVVANMTYAIIGMGNLWKNASFITANGSLRYALPTRTGDLFVIEGIEGATTRGPGYIMVDWNNSQIGGVHFSILMRSDQLRGVMLGTTMDDVNFYAVNKKTVKIPYYIYTDRKGNKTRSNITLSYATVASKNIINNTILKIEINKSKIVYLKDTTGRYNPYLKLIINMNKTSNKIINVTKEGYVHIIIRIKINDIYKILENLSNTQYPYRFYNLLARGPFKSRLVGENINTTLYTVTCGYQETGTDYLFVFYTGPPPTQGNLTLNLYLRLYYSTYYGFNQKTLSPKNGEATLDINGSQIIIKTAMPATIIYSNDTLQNITVSLKTPSTILIPAELGAPTEITNINYNKTLTPYINNTTINGKQYYVLLLSPGSYIIKLAQPEANGPNNTNQTTPLPTNTTSPPENQSSTPQGSPSTQPGEGTPEAHGEERPREGSEGKTPYRLLLIVLVPILGILTYIILKKKHIIRPNT